LPIDGSRLVHRQSPIGLFVREEWHCRT
jgi:hypothetical protein